MDAVVTKELIEGVYYSVGTVEFYGETYTDRPTFASSWAELQEMIDQAENGRRITLYRDYSASRGDKALNTHVGQILTIDLNGHTLNGSGLVNVIENYGPLTLIDTSRNKTGKITNGKNIGVENHSKMTISDVTITGNNGHGVNNENVSSVLTLNNCSITSNHAYNGGGIRNEGTLTMNGGTVSDNTAEIIGGGICNVSSNAYSYGIIVLNGVTVSNNKMGTEGSNGAGIYTTGALTLNGCTVTNNSSEAGNTIGGGIYFSGKSLSISGTTVVTGNKVNNIDNDLFIDINCKVAINGPLSADSKIGIRRPEYRLDDEFTAGLNGNGSASNFISNHSGYKVYQKSNGEASFDVSYSVTVNSAEHGTVVADPMTAVSGETVSLNVTPDEEYVLDFLTVTDADDNEITVTDNKFTMPASVVMVKAVFRKNVFTVTYEDTEHGTVTGVGTANVGDEVELTVTPDEDYALESLTVKDAEDNEITVTDNKFTMPASNVTVTAVFKQNVFAVTYENTEHGSVIGVGTANVGDEVQLTVTPDTGYKFSTLTVKTSDNQYIEVSDGKFIMPEDDVTVTAVFEAKAYDIAYADTEGGWVRGAYSANYGEEISLQVIAADGYELETLTITDANGQVISVSNNKFTMPDTNVTVAVTFKKRNLSITYVVTGGQGTITGESTAQFNDEVPLTITPAEGYALLTLDAKLDNEWDEYTNIIDGNLIMPDCNVIVSAEFAPITPAKEPWIDENGEYHLGNIEHCNVDGYYYEVVDGVVGDQLDSVELSYFDFKLLSDNIYQINYYTGSYDGLDELVIPKTYNGKKITVLGTGVKGNSFMKSATGDKAQFKLVLNENIKEIKGYTFWAIWVTEVKGNTESLNKIGSYAFSWANSRGGYTLNIKLDYLGKITVGKEIFNNMNVTARIKQATTFSSTSFSQKDIQYIMTDDTHTYGNPTWKWSDDNSTVVATFTCTDSRCRHQETVNATITSETKDGIITYTATAVLEGQTYTDTKEVFADGVGATLAGHSISLDGDIAVNFYMEIAPEVISHEGVYMQFTVPNTSKEYQNQKIYIKDLDPVEVGDKTYYVFKCKVAAKDMNSEISAQLIDGDKTSTVYKYSVKEYADYLIEHQDDNQTFKEAVPLVEAMLKYGTYANNYFSDADALEALDVDIPAKEASVTALPEGVEFDGATLSLKSQTTLSLYFVSEQEITLSMNGKTEGKDYEHAHNGNEYVIRIRNISAAELNDDFTVTVTTNGQSGTVTYSPMTYCYKAANSQAIDVKLKNVVKALYQYWLEADQYFNQNLGGI